MVKDISGRDDIEKIVNSFYEKVNRDELISGFFSGVNWDKHLPIMYNFWSDIIFGGNTFTGNPMAKHLSLNQRIPMEDLHFERWLLLFHETVDAMYKGSNAELIKQRALSIATVMRIKIAQVK